MMQETRIIMGMPITLMVPPGPDTDEAFQKTFAFFQEVDQLYSPYIDSSEVSRINRREISESDYSFDMHGILSIAAKTKVETDGYFDVWHDGTLDPSGIVKGWALQRATSIMHHYFDNFYVEAGGDIQVRGTNGQNTPWRIGIRNPFDRNQNVSVVSLDNHAIATSGTSIRGQHIYDPVGRKPLTDIVSLSVIAPKIVDADRMATAAFAMGSRGIDFIERLTGYEAFMIDAGSRVTSTSGWKNFEVQEP